MDKAGIRGVKKQTDNRFVNLYQAEAVRRDGSTFSYDIASRAADVEQLKIYSDRQHMDGVMIFALYGEKRDRVVMVRQYRYPVGDYVYEFPAGLVENGEDYHRAAVRELQEETGLKLDVLSVDPMFERGFFTTDGLTDECCGMVYGYCSGEPDLGGLEATEDIEVVLADRSLAAEILRSKLTALPTAYQLMHFIHDEDPFSFLQLNKHDDHLS